MSYNEIPLKENIGINFTMNVSAPLVMVCIEARKRTLARKTVHQNGIGSIETSFDPPQFFSL